MAVPTSLNDQVTDAVAQTGTKVLGDAPALAAGTVYQSLAHSTGLMFETAVSNFHQLCIAGQAATNQGVIQIYSVSSMAGAVATNRLARADAGAAGLGVEGLGVEGLRGAGAGDAMFAGGPLAGLAVR
jgi:hypothetical protein